MTFSNEAKELLKKRSRAIMALVFAIFFLVTLAVLRTRNGADFSKADFRSEDFISERPMNEPIGSVKSSPAGSIGSDGADPVDAPANGGIDGESSEISGLDTIPLGIDSEGFDSPKRGVSDAVKGSAQRNELNTPKGSVYRGLANATPANGRAEEFFWIDLVEGKIVRMSRSDARRVGTGQILVDSEPFHRLGIQAAQFTVAEYSSECMIDSGMLDNGTTSCEFAGRKPLRVEITDASRGDMTDQSSNGYWDVRILGTNDSSDSPAILSIRVNFTFRVIGDINSDGVPDFWQVSKADSDGLSDVNLLHVSQISGKLLTFHAVRVMDPARLNFK